MACRYYDDIIVRKLQRWIPEASDLRVLKPDETKRLFELQASDHNDAPLKLPLIAVSRSNDIELLLTTKNSRSFDGLSLYPAGTQQDLSKLKGEEYLKALQNVPGQIKQLNVIPIKLMYQIDIYTKTVDEADEYLRNFLFKLINNPVIYIDIPYNGINMQHIANLRVLPTVSDTSSITERLFSGQFTRWTIQLEVQDAFLFSVPYRQTWRLYTQEDGVEIKLTPEIDEATGQPTGNTIQQEVPVTVTKFLPESNLVILGDSKTIEELSTESRLYKT